MKLQRLLIAWYFTPCYRYLKMILAIYLILFKGYSVIKFEDEEINDNNNKKYGACSKPLGYNYGHNGAWGVGDTPIKAIIDAYKNSK